MKPGDHPEFFRFPPPEGRSRESSIVLTREGRFMHEGAPVEHPGMQRAFASWLARHPDDGRDILNNGYDWTYLTVEGARCFVQAIRLVAGQLLFELFDGRELAFEPGALQSNAEGRLFFALPGGELAQFTAAAQLQLSPWLVEQNGQIGVLLGGQFSPIRSADASTAP